MLQNVRTILEPLVTLPARVMVSKQELELENPFDKLYVEQPTIDPPTMEKDKGAEEKAKYEIIDPSQTCDVEQTEDEILFKCIGEYIVLMLMIEYH